MDRNRTLIIHRSCLIIRKELVQSKKVCQNQIRQLDTIPFLKIFQKKLEIERCSKEKGRIIKYK